MSSLLPLQQIANEQVQDTKQTMSRMSSRRAQTSRSWWEESDSEVPRIRKRDQWMQRIVGRVEKFTPAVPEKVLPILVLDRHVAEDFTMVEQMQLPHGAAGTGGENIYVNALSHAMKAKQHRKQTQMETIARDLQEALIKRRKEEERLAKIERQRLRRLNDGKRLAGERDEDEDEEGLGSMGLVPLELLPVNHPSHGSFRGLHPMFGNSKVRGYLPPETASTFMTRGPFLGNILPPPASAFQDAEDAHWQRNATPLHRDSLGALPTRGTFTAQNNMKKRRQRYSQMLLGETEAGSALFDDGSKPQLLSRAGSSAVLSTDSFQGDYQGNYQGDYQGDYQDSYQDSYQNSYQNSYHNQQPHSPPITQRLTPNRVLSSRGHPPSRGSADRVGIFDPNTGQQLIPLEPGNPVTEYLVGASDDALHVLSKSQQGIRLGGHLNGRSQASSIAAHSVANSIADKNVEEQAHSIGHVGGFGHDLGPSLEEDLQFLRSNFGLD